MAPDGYKACFTNFPTSWKGLPKFEEYIYKQGEMHVRTGSHGKGVTVFWSP